MRKFTFTDRLRYWFDNSLSKGMVSIIFWLAVLSLLIVLLASLVVWIFALLPEEMHAGGYTESFWQTFLHAIDAGTVAGNEAWPLRLVMFLVTIGGIFIVATLISAISSGLDAKLEDLRKGNSVIIEKNHTIILGWSSRIFMILRELIEANRNVKNSKIVILANRDKIEMDEEIRDRIEDFHGTKIITRSGNPLDLATIDVVNPQESKAIIVLSPKGSSDPDSQVIKQLLAIINSPSRRKKPYHIVAEMMNTDNLDAAKMVGKDEVEFVVAEDLISRIMVQTALQVGLSIVYKDLLDFDGDAIYFKKEEGLKGKTYGEALLAYEDSAVIGLANASGKVKLNPAQDTVIGESDKIIAIAADDDRVILGGKAEVFDAAIELKKKTGADPDNIIILGWNSKAETIVRELDHYVLPGSMITVVANDDQVEHQLSSYQEFLRNSKVQYTTGDTTNRKFLNTLDLLSYNHIILLSYEDLERNEADSKTIMTLLHLRDIESKKQESYSIVTEMLDLRNQKLAVIAKADDFIVSDELAGLLMTQISENKLLSTVFEDLFSAEGSEFYLKPAMNYLKTNQELNFYTVIEAAKGNKETAVGYRIMAEAANEAACYGVVLNPKKAEKFTLTDEDYIIVLADH